jgi:hypothetical protein
LDETQRFKVADYSYSYDRERDQHKEQPKKADNKEKEVSLEKRLSHAITAGYYMNAAMQCSNDSVYKCLSLPMINKDNNKPTSHDLRLVYISPQSSFAVITPSEYVIYQELVFNNKLYMRNVSYVSKKRLFSFINEWKPVSPLQLNGIVVVPSTTSTVNIKRERENSGKDDSTNKKVKSEEKEETTSLSFPVPTTTTTTTTTVSAENSGNRQKEIEQAKLRYLMRKKT